MYLEALTNSARRLFPKLASFEQFYLAGGTALALQLGHRLSVDFDLFTDSEIPVSFLQKVRRVFSDSSCAVIVNNADELTVFADNVKITFLRYPYSLLRDLVSFKGISMLAVPEIAATKAYTIGRRGSFKDYIDLYWVLKGKRSL